MLREIIFQVSRSVMFAFGKHFILFLLKRFEFDTVFCRAHRPITFSTKQKY